MERGFLGVLALRVGALGWGTEVEAIPGAGAPLYITQRCAWNCSLRFPWTVSSRPYLRCSEGGNAWEVAVSTRNSPALAAASRGRFTAFRPRRPRSPESVRRAVQVR